MQIIRKDNYDREGLGYDEVLVYSHPRLDEFLGRIITNIMNHCENDDSNFYFGLVPMDYKLRKFEP